MPEEGFANTVTDLLKEAMTDIQFELKDMFKGARPFRQPVIPEREQFYSYEMMSPEVKQYFQTQFPEQYNAYEQKMETLRRKYAR